MTRSRLKLNRLLIFKDENILYDEKFHDGINVIRGEHSVGKSTIFDLIFYALGGELKSEEWKEPADDCTKVSTEIEINDKVFTLSRDIKIDKKPDISIYDGSYEKSIKESSKWYNFGPVRRKKASFSEMLFEYLAWGEQKTDLLTNLTMHQILRLCYLSQSSDPIKIFRKELNSHGDNGNTRQAIAEFLFGLDDLQSYEMRQEKIKKENHLLKLESKLESNLEILNIPNDSSTNKISELIDDEKNKIKLLNKQKEEKFKSITFDGNKMNIIERESIQKEIKVLNINLSMISQSINKLKYEIDDCVLFSKSLDFRIKSLGESRSTYVSLGLVSFSHCPVCFSPIEDSSCVDKCNLCKKELKNLDLLGNYTETYSELKFQKNQNNQVLTNLRTRLEDNEKNLIKKTIDYEQSQRNLSELSYISNERELIIEKYAKNVSNIENKIKEYYEMIPIVKSIEEIKSEINESQQEISNLNSGITLLENSSKHRKEKVLDELAILSTKLLENDTGNEETFKNATNCSVEIDFEKDRWLLNERVSFSESSNAIKKSALHLAFLLQAIDDNETRYPLFSIMDFECADLNEERSKNLQDNIVKILENKGNFQLLITSSKVSDKLNNDRYGVGRYYSKNDYILKI
ncbi:MAG: AAA family ATPase [Arcobacteraceae bacterium]|nr:AAA family ATPase [Arcobacteraceae bacterium]